MHFLPMIFLAMRIFGYINARQIYGLIETINNIVLSRRANPGQKTVIAVSSDVAVFIFYFALDVCFVLYCIYLLFDTSTASQGFFLIATETLEAVARQFRIDGTYQIDAEKGFAYPTYWFRSLTFLMSAIVLVKLMQQ